MFAIRYVLTFVCEFFHGWKYIAKWGMKKYLSWCHTTAKYVAGQTVSLWLCANRTAWELMMSKPLDDE